MSDDQKSNENEDQILNRKRDILLSEIILRVSCLEKLIIAKTDITEAEISTAYIQATAKLMTLMEALEKEDNAKSS